MKKFLYIGTKLLHTLNVIHKIYILYAKALVFNDNNTRKTTV